MQLMRPARNLGGTHARTHTSYGGINTKLGPPKLELCGGNNHRIGSGDSGGDRRELQSVGFPDPMTSECRATCWTVRPVLSASASSLGTWEVDCSLQAIR